MALWGFSRESNQNASGANTVAGILKGYRPLPQSQGIAHSYDAPGDSAGNTEICSQWFEADRGFIQVAHI